RTCRHFHPWFNDSLQVPDKRWNLFRAISRNLSIALHFSLPALRGRRRWAPLAGGGGSQQGCECWHRAKSARFGRAFQRRDLLRRQLAGDLRLDLGLVRLDRVAGFLAENAINLDAIVICYQPTPDLLELLGGKV